MAEDIPPLLSLVIPAFNEGEGIATAIAEACTALAKLTPRYELIVVDDGSRDDTFAAASAVAGPRVRVLKHDKNRGYGAALRTGFTAARGELVAFTDADCQFDLADLAKLLPLTADAEVVTGFRVGRQDPWQRKFYSWGYNRLIRTLIGTGVRDCDCALKVFRRDALARILPDATGFFVNAEMFARARRLGLRVAEVGVSHRPRQAGVSKVSLAEVPKTLGVLLPFWWSRVLFTGASRTSAFTRREALGLFTVLTLALLLFFGRLGAGLLEPEEARYAEIPRQMLAAGEYVVPTLHGQVYLDKPPLFYWLVMAAYRTVGVSDAAARFVPALAAWLTIGVVWFWARRAAGPRAALLAALLLTLTPDFVYRARMLTMNGLLGLTTTAALACGHIALLNGTLRRGWWLLAGAAVGVGLLVKGPVAAALVLPPLFAIAWLDRRLARPTWRDWVGFGLMMALVAGPWYVAVMLRQPEFTGYFFWLHHIRRFVEPLDHQEPFWFYLPGLAAGLLPWSLLAVPLLLSLLKRAGKRRPPMLGASPPMLGASLLAALWGVLFFSLAGCKRSVYLLPVLPLVAMTLACHLDAWLPRERRFAAALWAWRSRLAYATVALALAGGVALGSVAAYVEVQKPARALLVAGLCGVSLAALAAWGRPRRASWGWAAAAVAVVMVAGVQELWPGYARRFSLRYQVQGHTADASRPVYCYPRRWDSVSFYLDRPDVRVFGPGERDELLACLKQRPDALLIVKTKNVEELLAGLPEGTGFIADTRREWVTVGRLGPQRPRFAAKPANRPVPLLSLPRPAE